MEALWTRVVGLEAELAGVRQEAAAAKSEMEYCRLAGQVYKGASKSAGRLAEKLSGEKRLLQKEMEGLVAGKVLNGRDKGTRMPAPSEPPVCVGCGVQTDLVGVSVVGIQTDISRVQVVRETTYASMATQTGAGGVGVDGDSVMGGVEVPDVGLRPVVGVEGLVRAQALLIHVVDCRRGVATLLAMARRLPVGECSVHGIRWLLVVGRRWGKRLSSVVVYLDRAVVVRGCSMWFSGTLHPVERYVFDR